MTTRQLWVWAGVVAGLNLVYLAWSVGAFALFGLLPARLAESEPQRVTQQIRPQVLNVGKNNAMPNP